MAMKLYSTLPKALGLELHYQIVKFHMKDNHRVGLFLPSAEMPLTYSTTLANWAEEGYQHSKWEWMPKFKSCVMILKKVNSAFQIHLLQGGKISPVKRDILHITLNYIWRQGSSSGALESMKSLLPSPHPWVD